MNTKILLVILFSCTTFFSYAQQFKTTVSEEYINKRSLTSSFRVGSNYLSVIEYNGIRGINSTLSLKLTDAQGKVVLKESAKETKIKKTLALEKLVLNGKVYILYQQAEGNRAGNIMAAEVDMNNLEILPAREIANLEKEEYESKVSVENTKPYKFFFKVSNDSSHVMIVLSNDKNASQLFVAMFNNKLELLWQKKETLNIEDDLVRIKDISPDNNGNAYIGYTVFEGVKNKLPAKGLNHILVLNNSKKVKDLVIDIGNAYIDKFKMLPSNISKSVAFAGYYYIDGSSLLKGVFSGRVNTATNTLENIRKDAFAPAVLKPLEKEKWAATGENYGIAAAIEPELFERADGSLSLIGEFRKIVWGEKSAYRISGSILNAQINSTATYFTRIPKFRNSAGNSTGDSYNAFTYEDKTLVFYNDNAKALENDIDALPESSTVYKNVVLVGAVIQADGTVKRQILIDQSNENFMANTSIVAQINKNTFNIIFYKVKGLSGFADGYKLGTVEIQ